MSLVGILAHLVEKNEVLVGKNLSLVGKIVILVGKPSENEKSSPEQLRGSQ